MCKRCLIFLLPAFLLLSLAAAPQPQNSVTYERYDVDIDIQADGSLHVAETYQIRFEGEFHTGFAEIPLDYVTDVVDVQVRESEQVYTEEGFGPGTFSTEYDGDVLYVEWEYEPTAGTEVRTFTVEYRVLGGLWVYPDGDLLSWTAIPVDRGGIPVKASRVTVRMPAPVEPDDLTASSYGAETTLDVTDEGQTVVFEAVNPIPDGVALGVEVGFPPDLTAATAQDWQRASDEIKTVYRWQALDVALTIAPDGTLAVTEEHTLAVDEGYLYHGYREIPWLYLDDIAELGVWEGERAFEFSTGPCDYCYVVEEDKGRWDWVEFDGTRTVIHEDQVGSTLVEWAFPSVEAGDAATFRLDYTVLGAVRVLTDAQTIAWTAVFADRDVEVEAARLRLHLPPGVSAAEVTIEGGATAAQPDGTIEVTHSGPVPAGEAWSVRIRLPAGATTAAKPDWQQRIEMALEEERAYLEAERRAAVSRARWQLALGTLGCLIPVVGLVGVLIAWYVWGRDRPAPVVAQYLTEPPSDLPPGIVAYLVDEKPTTKGVLADLLQLATLGLISVDLQKPDFAITLNWKQKIEKNKVVRVAGGEEVALTKHERTLFNTLVEAISEKGHSTSTTFSRIQRAFTRALPTIYEQMGEAATQYFSVRPEEARRRWNWAGQIVVIAAGVLGLVGLCGMSSVGLVVCVPPIGLALVGLMLMGVSRWMPQRTTLGVEEAERWRAFRRYLKSLKQYGDLEAAQAVLDRYFAYAVALDVEDVVLEQAEALGALTPVWMAPVAVEVGAATVAEAERKRRTGVRLPGVLGAARGAAKAEPLRAAKVRPSLAERPVGADLSLDGLAGNLGRSLDRASRSLGSLLDTAAGEAQASPFEVMVKGAGGATKMTWKAGTSTMKVLGDILEASSSGGGGGGYSGGKSRSRSRSSSFFRSSSWSSSSPSSSRSSSRSSRSSSRSSSRRSGGGGRRGFR